MNLETALLRLRRLRHLRSALAELIDVAQQINEEDPQLLTALFTQDDRQTAINWRNTIDNAIDTLRAYNVTP